MNVAVPDPEGPADPASKPRIDRRRLDEIFGEVLPESTLDDRDPGGSRGRGLDWYLENRPPHHGG